MSGRAAVVLAALTILLYGLFVLAVLMYADTPY